MTANRLSILSLLLLIAGISALASDPVLIGRRGCGYAVENSAEAYREGARRGYKMMEAHVRLTADSVFVTSHDGKTDRLGGKMKIPGSTLAELRTERYSQQRDSGYYGGATICTVGEFLDVCKEAGISPLLHLKTITKDTKQCQFLTALATLIAEKGLTDRCIILTSEPDYIEYLMEHHPALGLQFQADTKWEERFDWSTGKKLDVQIRADLVDADVVKRYHDSGVKVNVWTVNTPEDYARYKEMGVDYIVTDYLMPR